MNRKLSLVSGLAIMAAVLTPHFAFAAVVTPPGVIQAGDSLVQKAHDDDDWRYKRRYWQYGDDWRYKRYRRYDFYPSDRYNDRCYFWRRACASRWGWGGWEFRSCLWRHGC